MPSARLCLDEQSAETWRDLMASIPKVVGVLSCGFVLSLGLSNPTRAEHLPSPSDVMKTDSISDRQGFQDDADKQMHDGMGGIRGSKHIKGELFRVDGDSYYIMLRDDTELRIRTDKTTVMSGDIKKGDLIEAKINDRNHALSIRSTKRK
jgi:hypothetical protein